MSAPRRSLCTAAIIACITLSCFSNFALAGPIAAGSVPGGPAVLGSLTQGSPVDDASSIITQYSSAGLNASVFSNLSLAALGSINGTTAFVPASATNKGYSLDFGSFVGFQVVNPTTGAGCNHESLVRRVHRAGGGERNSLRNDSRRRHLGIGPSRRWRRPARRHARDDGREWHRIVRSLVASRPCPSERRGEPNLGPDFHRHRRQRQSATAELRGSTRAGHTGFGMRRIVQCTGRRLEAPPFGLQVVRRVASAIDSTIADASHQGFGDERCRAGTSITRTVRGHSLCSSLSRRTAAVGNSRAHWIARLPLAGQPLPALDSRRTYRWLDADAGRTIRSHPRLCQRRRVFHL